MDKTTNMQLLRFTDSNGDVPLSPLPAACLVENGKPIEHYTLDELIDLALVEIKRQRTNVESVSGPLL